MDQDYLGNPHDRFTRHMLANLDNVRELVRRALPGEVVEQLDLASLRPAKQSFVDQTLRSSHTDLVFETQLANGAEAFVVLLLEHKSSPDELTAFQVLRYIVRLGEERLRNKQPLCPVLPIVLYHGPRPWNAARSVRELVGGPAAFLEFVPDFTLPLVDLSQWSDDELREESLFMAYMSLLKYIHDDSLPARLVEFFRLLRRLLPPASGMECLEAVLRYLFSGASQLSNDVLQAAVVQVFHEEGESLMPTIAEQVFQAGLEKGEQQGIEQGIQQGINRGLAHGVLIGKIQLFQQILGHAISSPEELRIKSLEDLAQLLADLEALSHENRN
ncbi:MAG: Rpn family recombination-promoting nuclease/putative transposase [Planctomycetales bacterium]|nr:Rpn family recombination-promoting nuclease/putative transposase [Planctomycetales bacterium]